jgi:hypothetical protein
MFVKAIKRGFRGDKNVSGGYVEVQVGQVFQVPEGSKAQWFIECDEQGRPIQLDVIEKNLEALEARANAAENEAKLADGNAKIARKNFEEEKKRVAEVKKAAEEKAKKPPKAPPAA